MAPGSCALADNPNESKQVVEYLPWTKGELQDLVLEVSRTFLQ